MEIGRGKLPLIGKRGQRLDGSGREWEVVGYTRGDGMYDGWLGVANIEVIKSTRDTLIQSCDRQIKQLLASVFSPEKG